MDNDVKYLLSLIYEIEGLTLVMQRRHDNVPPQVIDQLKLKISNLTSEVKIIEEKLNKQRIKDKEDVTANKKATETQHIQPAEPQQPAPAVTVTPPAYHPAPSSSKETVATSTASEPPAFTGSNVNSTTPPPATATASSPKEHNIMAAFSINDRFLFQRELFDGDNTRFNDTIAKLQGMTSIEQVKEYVTNTLKWNADDEVVVEFLRLVGMSFE